MVHRHDVSQPIHILAGNYQTLANVKSQQYGNVFFQPQEIRNLYSYSQQSSHQQANQTGINQNQRLSATTHNKLTFLKKASYTKQSET